MHRKKGSFLIYVVMFTSIIVGVVVVVVVVVVIFVVSLSLHHMWVGT